MRSQLENVEKVRDTPLTDLRLSSADSRIALNCIKHLIKFVSKDDTDLHAIEYEGEPFPSRQRLLFDVGVHEIIISFACKLFDTKLCQGWAPGVTISNARDFREFNNICLHGYHLVRLMCKDNTYNGFAIAGAHSSKFLSQAQLLSRVKGIDWDIPGVLEAMYHENASKLA